MNLDNEKKLSNGLTVAVDWISFTFQNHMSWFDVADLFGIPTKQFQTGLIGSYGYKTRVRHMIYPISILYDGSKDMGIHIDVPGSAVDFLLDCYCKKYLTITPFNTYAYEVESFDQKASALSDVMEMILNHGKLTRLDLSIDDMESKYYTIPELREIFSKGNYSSRFKKYRIIYEGGKNENGDCFVSGETIYLGSRKSELMFRIYNKQLERSAKKHESISHSWVRWEIELHRDRASYVASLIAGGKCVADAALGILSNYLRLTVKDNSRGSRCSTSEKWIAFLNDVEKARLYMPPSKKTLAEKRDWVIKQVAPTLAAIYHADGDLGFVYSVINSGTDRMSLELKQMVEEYLNGLAEGVAT